MLKWSLWKTSYFWYSLEGPVVLLYSMEPILEVLEPLKSARNACFQKQNVCIGTRVFCDCRQRNGPGCTEGG